MSLLDAWWIWQDRLMKMKSVLPRSVHVENNYIVGQDALDIARLANVNLNRNDDRLTEPPVYSWRVVEQLIAGGNATLEEFYLNLAALTPQESSDIIQCLVGAFKVWHDFSNASKV